MYIARAPEQGPLEAIDGRMAGLVSASDALAEERYYRGEAEMNDRLQFTDEGGTVIRTFQPDVEALSQMDRFSPENEARLAGLRSFGEVLGESRSLSSGIKRNSRQEFEVVRERTGLNGLEQIEAKRGLLQELGAGLSTREFLATAPKESLRGGAYPQVDVGFQLAALRKSTTGCSLINLLDLSSMSDVEIVMDRIAASPNNYPVLVGKQVQDLTGGPIGGQAQFRIKPDDQLSIAFVDRAKEHIVAGDELADVSRRALVQIRDQGFDARALPPELVSEAASTAKKQGFAETLGNFGAAYFQGAQKDTEGKRLNISPVAARTAFVRGLQQLQMAENNFNADGTQVNAGLKAEFQETGNMFGDRNLDVPRGRVKQTEQEAEDIRRSRSADLPTVMTADGQVIEPEMGPDPNDQQRYNKEKEMGIQDPRPVKMFLKKAAQNPVARQVGTKAPLSMESAERFIDNKVANFNQGNQTPQEFEAYKRNYKRRFMAKQQAAIDAWEEATAPHYYAFGCVGVYDANNSGLRDANIIDQEVEARQGEEMVRPMSALGETGYADQFEVPETVNPNTSVKAQLKGQRNPQDPMIDAQFRQAQMLAGQNPVQAGPASDLAMSTDLSLNALGDGVVADGPVNRGVARGNRRPVLGPARAVVNLGGSVPAPKPIQQQPGVCRPDLQEY